MMFTHYMHNYTLQWCVDLVGSLMLPVLYAKSVQMDSIREKVTHNVFLVQLINQQLLLTADTAKMNVIVSRSLKICYYSKA